MKLALLIIDMQKLFLNDRVEKQAIDQACEYINYVADLLRAKNHPVIHVQDIEALEEVGGEALEFIPEIKIEPNDYKITKLYSNAFWNTELDSILKKEEVGFVVVSGFAAEHCVLFTYNGAIERGYKTAILQRGILSTQRDIIPQTYRDRNLISYPVIEFMLSQ